jgi:hypothetical protein
MRPTWCGPTPRTPRSSTTLPNRPDASCAGCPPLHGERSPRCGLGVRLVDDLSSLIAVAGCRRSLADRRSEAANGGQPVRQRTQLLAGAETRQRRRAGKTLTVRRCGQSPVRSEVDPERRMVNPPIAPNSLQLPLLFLKAGPAGGLRPPSGPATTRRSPGAGLTHLLRQAFPPGRPRLPYRRVS